MKKVQKNKGFTLIELLVVIAIIGVLSSLVLFSIASARVKALNSARQQKVVQWRSALELYRLNSPGGHYPGVVGGYYCLGQSAGTSCSMGTGVPGLIDPTFNSQMSPYISSGGGQDVTIAVPAGPGNRTGVTYMCPEEDANGACLVYWIMWAVQKSTNCKPGETGAADPNGNSACFFSSKKL